MHRVVGPVLASLLLALATPLVAGVAARDLSRPPSPVVLSVVAGYREQYRTSAWVPVHVTVRNRTASLLQGTVAIPDRGGNSQYSAPAYSALYQTPIVLPPGATKHATLYLPGQDISDQVNVQFLTAGKVVASVSNSPLSFDDQTIAVGALVNDPQIVSWVDHIKPPHSSVVVVNLSPTTLDPVAEALATFDAIVLTNFDTSRLDRDQLVALQRYVQDGGSLILVGGPDWQETLRPLPPTLLPGDLSGSRTVADLSGLQALVSVEASLVGAPPRKDTIVSLLSHPRGAVLASEAGIPLVVRQGLGRGRIIYLAFDPAVDSIPHWSGAASLLTDLVMQAAPQVVSHLSLTGWQSGFFAARFGPTTIRQELANVPAATWPSVVLLVLLTVFSFLVLGPLNFLLLHRLGKRELAWITIPALALLCLGSTLGAAFRLKGNTVLLNTVSMVELDGNTGSHPTTLYVGLFASVRGDYHMVWDGKALPQSLPPYSFDQTSVPSASAPGLSLQEGAQTAVDFRSMDMWSTRSVALKTTVTIPGTVRGNLHLAPDGSIVGVVRNSTNLTLIRPVVLAGRAVFRLSDLPPEATQAVHIRPYVDVRGQSHSLLWEQIYGPSPTSGDLGSWDGDPWEEPPPAAEKSFTDRLRNVAERLPEAWDITSAGEVLFVGWSERPLGTFTVDGATPRRRDLNLIVTPLSVRFPQGSFQLRPGTLGASLIDDRPQMPGNGCCEAPSTKQAVALGPGGSATFQFDVPNAPHIHFRRLTLAVDAGGADESGIGQVYDWRTKRWVHINLRSGNAPLPDPNRFLSSAGALLVRLTGTNESGDIVLTDPHQDLQLSGWATVR